VGKPVAGEIVIIPFPQTDLAAGKRRPALVVAELAGEDLILCQITSRARSDGFSIPLDSADFEHGQLRQLSYIRPQRLFTVDARVILYSAGKVRTSKLAEVLAKLRGIFR
jgi:mRNA-degrading endonuclease toxin of MazEF toxin-antitoxin module